MSGENVWGADWVPWNRPGEWVIWLVALILATLFIHNFTRLAGARLLDGGAE